MTKFTEYAPGTPNWVDLSAADGEAAAKWYGDLFGWTATRQDTGGGPPYWMFTLGDESIAGMGEINEEMKAAGVPPMWNTYVAVADVDATVATAVAHGGSVRVPAMDVMDAGRMAWIIDPDGADVGIWQARNHIGCTVCNEPGAFCWSELDLHDLPKVQPFYEQVFGWTFTPDENNPATSMISNGDAMIAHTLKMDPEWGPIPAHWSTYFAVADIAATVQKVQDTGGTLIVPPMQIPPGTFALLMDPQGARFYAIELAE